ncbi:hypothetical protein YC2023_016318 [Brassica napus]|uniref:(rape) hypothetical protein n=1 Tax=Brassica napus TaxID=3708 RepID=A0A816K0N3_BRANA|nr:unnamed protein product [Brassica napus]
MRHVRSRSRHNAMSENTEAQNVPCSSVRVCVFFASLASLPQTGGGFVTFLVYLDINKGSSFISLSPRRVRVLSICFSLTSHDLLIETH